jgi:hypothetical protein
MPQVSTVRDALRRCRGLLALLAIVQIAPAAAQTAVDGQPGGGRGFTASDAAEIKSLKEKLSDKASDEQRIDNCRVPPDRRGTTPRPDCPADRTATAAPAGSVR